MNHDELMEQATRTLAAVLERIERRGTCPLCLGALLEMVAAGLVGDGAEADLGEQPRQ